MIECDLDFKRFEYLLKDIENYKPDFLWQQLALIILLDQIPRNIYRGTPDAYKYDFLIRPLVL